MFCSKWGKVYACDGTGEEPNEDDTKASAAAAATGSGSATAAPQRQQQPPEPAQQAQQAATQKRVRLCGKSSKGLWEQLSYTAPSASP